MQVAPALLGVVIKSWSSSCHAPAPGCWLIHLRHFWIGALYMASERYTIDTLQIRKVASSLVRNIAAYVPRGPRQSRPGKIALLERERERVKSSN